MKKIIYFLILISCISCRNKFEEKYVIEFDSKTGNKLREGMLINGKKNGIWLIYETEKITEVAQYQNDTLHGIYIGLSSDDGVVIYNGSYVENEKHGNWYYHNSVGMLGSIRKYERDSVIEFAKVDIENNKRYLMYLKE